MTESKKHSFDLPDKIPLLPIKGVMLLSGARLPLNIYQTKNKKMVEEALKGSRMIGIIQPTDEDDNTLYNVGCAGRITTFAETEDDRYLITLLGHCRFEVLSKHTNQDGYIVAEPEWKNYVGDLAPPNQDHDIDRERLIEALKKYFSAIGLAADYEVIMSTDADELIASLAILCPFEPSEKQALLEASSVKDRANCLLSLLEMATLYSKTDKQQKH